MFSKIVAVADGFDAATSRRSYQTDPLSPAAVLAEMRDNPRRGIDSVVVKAFINLLGIYPVGTLVVLDTFELAIVHSANPNPEAVSRPIVRIVSDERGNVAYPGRNVDLAEQDAGRRVSCARSSRRRTQIGMASTSATISSDALTQRFAALRERRAPRARLLRHGRPSGSRAIRRAAARHRGGRRGRHRARRSVLRSDGRRPDHPGELAAGARARHDARTACST